MRDEEMEQMDERMQTDGMIDRATGRNHQPKVELPHLAEGKREGGRRMDGKESAEREKKSNAAVDAGMEAAEEMADPALARKLADEKEMSRGKERDEERDEGSWLGTLAIVLSVLSLILVPFILAPAGIVLGVIGGSRRSQLGWWAVGVGVFSLIINLFAAPYLRLY